MQYIAQQKVVIVTALVVTTTAKQLFSRSRRLQNATKKHLKSRMCNMTLDCRYRSNSGGFLKSLNTDSPRWWPIKWDIRFVELKLDAFFPPLGILAEHALQIAMALSSSATEKNFQTGEGMFTNDDVMSATQAESHCNLNLQSLALGKLMNLR